MTTKTKRVLNRAVKRQKFLSEKTAIRHAEVWSKQGLHAYTKAWGTTPEGKTIYVAVAYKKPARNANARCDACEAIIRQAEYKRNRGLCNACVKAIQ